MLITDGKKLREYYSDRRLWQGIPGIEVTKNGRIFSAFYSGGCDEEVGNYVVLLKSDDGIDFGEPIAVAYKENARCFDECIWIDPLGRLWLIWSVMPDNGVYGVICDDPDADELVWGKEFFIGNDVMLNKPIVLSTGEWLFPISVWGERVWSWMPERRTGQKELGAFVYKTTDMGKSFEKMGRVVHPDHSFDEHMLLELNDYRIMMLTRTMKGLGISYSYDRGKTWSPPKDSGIAGPNARFHIRRLKSGRILLVNHYNFKGRNNMTALLSDDECKSWKYKLLIDERDEVSYPDAAEAEDGYIYITYDRERGYVQKNMEKIYASAREILYAKITEDDIIAGKLINPGSKLKYIISKLGEYKGEKYPFDDKPRYLEYVPYYANGSKNEIAKRLFGYFYKSICPILRDEEQRKLDLLIDQLDDGVSDKNTVVHEIIKLFCNAESGDKTDVVGLTREAVMKNLPVKMSEADIADELGLSKYLLHYRFKMLTGITVEEYRDTLIEVSQKIKEKSNVDE